VGEGSRYGGGVLACNAHTRRCPLPYVPNAAPRACAAHARTETHTHTHTHTHTQGVRAKVLGPGGRETEVMLEGDLKLGLALCKSTAELERHGPVIKHSLRYVCMPCVGACSCACACRVYMRARARETGGSWFLSSVVNMRVCVCASSGRHCGRKTCRQRWSLLPSSLHVPTPRRRYWSSPCFRSSQRSRRPNPRPALGRKRRNPRAVEANLCLLLPLLITLASPPLRLVPASQTQRFEEPRLPRDSGAAARMCSQRMLSHMLIATPPESAA